MVYDIDIILDADKTGDSDRKHDDDHDQDNPDDIVDHPAEDCLATLIFH